MTKTVILIPSRFSASRLPGKPLLKINGKSIISHVVDKAKASKIGDVYVATDKEIIVEDVKSNGGKAILTSKYHKTGTDRIYECFQKLNLRNIDYIINLHRLLPFWMPHLILKHLYDLNYLFAHSSYIDFLSKVLQFHFHN